MGSSLSLKIIFRIGLAVSCCVFLLGIVEYYQTSLHANRGLDTALAATGLRLSRSLAMPMWNMDKGVIENIVLTEMQDRNISAVVVIDNLSNEHLVAKGRDENWEATDSTDTFDLQSFRSTDMAIMFSGEELGKIRVFMTEKYVDEERAEKIIHLVVRLAVLLLLVLAVLIFFINSIISRPILHLRRSCKKVVQGDYSAELDVTRNDEIGSLARSFAEMRDGIREKITALNKEIWERKRSEEELQSLRTYLGNIIDSMPSLLFTIDKNHRVNQWNLEAEKTIGVDSAEARGRIFFELLPDMLEVTDMVDDALLKTSVRSVQRLPLQISGKKRIVDITVYPLIANGSVGAVVRLDDVTDRVRIDELMVQTEKMMSVGGLAAGMAHEINNPLAGIMQSTQVIQNRLLPELKKNRKVAAQCGTSMEHIDCYHQSRDITKMLTSILESGERAARIITNMLSFSRKSSSEFLPCTISDLLDKTLDLAANDYDLKTRFDFRKIEIIRQYDSGVAQVRCDAGAIQQVFLNILKNGAQAIVERLYQYKADDSVSRKPVMTLRIYQDEKSVYVDVEDTGIGMDEETVKRVFEPFFSTKEVGVGTGLGLSVSYFIIKENHQGSIEVTSTPGVGTTFTVALPRIDN